MHPYVAIRGVGVFICFSGFPILNKIGRKNNLGCRIDSLIDCLIGCLIGCKFYSSRRSNLVRAHYLS